MFYLEATPSRSRASSRWPCHSIFQRLASPSPLWALWLALVKFAQLNKLIWTLIFLCICIFLYIMFVSMICLFFFAWIFLFYFSNCIPSLHQAWRKCPLACLHHCCPLALFPATIPNSPFITLLILYCGCRLGCGLMHKRQGWGRSCGQPFCRGC